MNAFFHEDGEKYTTDKGSSVVCVSLCVFVESYVHPKLKKNYFSEHMSFTQRFWKQFSWALVIPIQRHLWKGLVDSFVVPW